MKNEDIVLNAVKGIFMQKESENIIPSHALDIEIFCAVDSLRRCEIENALFSLAEQGKLKVGDTLNYRYYIPYSI